MMVTIFKRYEGSEFEEVLVQAGVVAAGSVKQALTGKHFRRGSRCIRLFYEALISKLMRDKPLNINDENRQRLEILKDTVADQETPEAAHEALLEDKEITQFVKKHVSEHG